jgi:acyl-CoA dehydrogenase
MYAVWGKLGKERRMEFWPPVEEARPLVEEAQALMDGPVKTAIAAHEEADSGGKLPDGAASPERGELKREMHRLGAKAGLYAPHVSEPLGGRGRGARGFLEGLDVPARGGVLEGVRRSAVDPGLDDGPSPMVEAATKRAVEEFVKPLMRAEITTAFAVTEPEAGSDATNIQTLARRSGDDWVITGHKHLISNAPFAEVVQVIARTEDGKFGVFLVPTGTEGFTRGPVQQTMLGDGQTGELRFEDCRVPSDMTLGEPSAGFGMPMRWINWTRARRAGMCVGLARHCLDRALAHARERRAFGKPIGAYEQVAVPISDAYRRTYAGRAACDRLLTEIDATGDPWERPDATTQANFSAIKLIAEECLLEASDVALQVFGGLGLLRSTGIELIFRVARNLRIPAGTTEMQNRTIARSLGLLATGEEADQSLA